MASGAFAQHFADWCPQTVIVEPWLGTFDEYGNPDYGAGIPFSCRIESTVRMVRDVQGNDRASNTIIIVLGGPFDPHDRVTMPVTFKGPEQPPIINVSNVNDKTEFSHSEIYL